ncbi:MAG: right-handed parallel beta-helix repeat-containing protein, partial [Dethiobacteria bacterium]
MKERRFTFTVLAALAILLLVLLAAPAAAADGDVYLIDQFGTTVGTYTSIKAAVNDADEGYTILVSPGTYNETGVEINKENITLKSTGGADVTIIDSRSSVSDPDGTTCLRFSASSFSVEGFTLYSNQNGIYSSIALNNGKITIKDNIIRCYDVDDTSPGHGIGLIVNSAVAAVDTEIEITGNDIAASGRNNAALHLEMNLVRSRVVISNNNISDSYRGIFLSRTVGYPGYEDPEGAKPEHASEVVIENNTIKKISGPGSDITLNGGISVYAVSYGSVHIQGNELVDCRRGIAVGYCGNAGAETDVQILNNKISLSESPPDWNYETAIYVSAPERVFRIEGNTIKGQPGYYYDDGIYLGYIGYYVDKFEGYVLNNEVSYCLKGLTNEDFCLKDGDGSLYVNDNVFTDNDSGIHFKEIYYDEDPDEPYYFMGYLEIKNNVFKNNRGGLVLPVLDYELSPVSVLAEGNLFEGNASGLYLEAETWLGGSEVLIWNNYFKDNESGIDCMKVSPSVKIYLNAFTGNDRGLYYLEGSTLD